MFNRHATFRGAVRSEAPAGCRVLLAVGTDEWLDFTAFNTAAPKDYTPLPPSNVLDSLGVRPACGALSVALHCR